MILDSRYTPEKAILCMISFKSVVTKLRPAKVFHPARRALIKNVYAHFEPQLDRIIPGTPQLQVFTLFFPLENTPRFLGEK